MHIADGILTAPMMAGTGGLAIAGVARGLYKMDTEDIPRVGIVAAVLFMASLIHVPIGPVSAHLVLTGLAGLLLGWRAFPAIAAALFLQVIFFGFGGLTTLGSNTLNMALPAVTCGLLLRPVLRHQRAPAIVFVLGAIAGAAGILLSGAMVAGTLYLTGREFSAAAVTLLAAHVPVLVVEAMVTGFVLVFLQRVAPDLVTGELRGRHVS